MSSKRRKKRLRLYDELFDVQQEGVDGVINDEVCALFFEQGTGKTWTTGGILEKLIEEDLEFTGLLVCKLTNLETTWLTFLNEKLPYINVCLTWKDFKAAQFPKIFLIHYEGVKNKSVKRAVKKFKWSFGCADESQGLKARGSQQSRVLGGIKYCIRRLILTGTPIDGEEIDLWAQFRFAKPELFGTAWKDFDEGYLKPCGYMGYQRKFRSTHSLKRFLKRMAPYCMTLKKTDLKGKQKLPKMHEPRRVYVKMYGEQKRVYRELERDMLVRMGKSRTTTPLKVTQLVKLQQVTGGFIIDDEGETIGLGSAKARKAFVYMKYKKWPLVIFCKFRHELFQLEALAKRLTPKVKTLYGKNKKERPSILRDFQSGKIDILIAQIKTGGVGVDLFRSCRVIVYSSTFSFIDFEQALARVHRYGQKEEVRVWLLVAKDTIDEDIFSAILSKQSVSVRVIKELRNKRREQNG